MRARTLREPQGAVLISLSVAEAKLRSAGLQAHDATIHLTASGAPMPNLHIAAEMSFPLPREPSFRVAGGVPGGTVHYRVAFLCTEEQ